MTADTRIAPPTPAQRALDALSNLAIGIAATALLGLVLVQGWQVFTRYVLNDSPSWTEPVTLLLLSTAMSLAAAAGVHTRRHFGFFLLAEHTHALVRRAIDVIGPLVVVVIGAVITRWGVVLLLDGLDIRIAGASLPQSINYLPLSLGGALMVVFALYQLLLALRPGAAAPLPPASATAADGDL